MRDKANQGDSKNVSVLPVMKSNWMLSSFQPKSMRSKPATSTTVAASAGPAVEVEEEDWGEFSMSRSEALGWMPLPALVMTSANVGHLAAMVGGDFFKRGLSMAVCLVVGRPFATKAIKARMNTTWRGARLISKPLGGPEKNEADEITRKECANKA